MKSVKARIMSCMILTVAVGLLIVGGVSIALNYSSTNELLERSMSETAKVAAQRISEELHAYTNVAYEMGCVARLTSQSSTAEEKKALIDQRAKTHGFERGNVLDPTGRSIFDGKDYSQRSYFQSAIKGETSVSEPLISQITGELTIIVAAPLWEGGIPDTKVAGVVYFVPKETFLNDIMSSIKISENSGAYMIDQKGITIADTVMDSIVNQQNIQEEAKTSPELESLAAIHVLMRQGKNGFGSYSINGVSKFAAYAPVSGTNGWSVAITAPSNDFIGSTMVSIFLTVALLLVSILVSALIAMFLASRIGKPIRVCAERLKLLAKGDLKTPVAEVRSQDEIGVLAKATVDMVNDLRTVIGDVDYCLGEMGSGNFDVHTRAEESYVGDFRKILLSMRSINQKLSEALSNINTSSEQVSSGAGQVSAGAQALSQGATEQASAVEELAATVAEVSERVEQNADTSHRASKKAQEAAGEMEQGKQQTAQMIEAISEIDQTSAQIGQIIKTIDDIAFQTNILALNAAVEAARAGAAGKGFAVVADEVRSLANKSQEAAKNTTGLIQSIMGSIQRGTEMAGSTEATMNQIAASAEEVAGLVHSISQASREQATSISQIRQGIDQISSVVQTNSATAEESAAASEELSSQAQLLKDLVGGFRLKETAAGTRSMDSFTPAPSDFEAVSKY